MSAYDASGMERVPFDPFGGESRTLAYAYRSRTPNHGPTCRPSNPEIGCECGYAEWRDEMRERAETRTLPRACPKCGESPIDFSAPCPSCWTDWSALIGGAR